jgi:hypothetical protein
VKSRLLLLAVGCALLGSFIVFSNEYANHAPGPHNIPIQVVGSPHAVAQLQTGLAKASPGGFSITQASSPAAATRAILRQQADGAIILAGNRPAQILTAGAQGLTLQQQVEKALSSAAAHRRVVVSDLVPLPSADHSGLSGSNFSLALAIPGVLGSVLLYLSGRRSRVWWRITAAALYAVLVSLFGVLILDFGFGALTGHFAAVFAIGAFGALSYMLFAFACQEIAGTAGTGFAALFFIFIGIVVNGATTPAPLLPAVYREISPWTPNGAIVRAVRAVTYFHGYGLGQPLLALAIWSAAALLVIAGNDLRRVADGGNHPERAHVSQAAPASSTDIRSAPADFAERHHDHLPAPANPPAIPQSPTSHSPAEVEP